MLASITTGGSQRMLQQIYRQLETGDQPPAPPLREDPRHERLVEYLDPEQYPEPVRHWAVPFHTLGVQLLHSMPSGPEKRCAFRHLLEAQLAAVQSHWELSCLYCQRPKESCRCKPGAVR